MQMMQIQGLDWPVSRLIMGSDFFSTDKMELVSRMLESYLSIGGNVVDTAFLYSGGNSEKAIGLWLEQNRDKGLMVLTKGAHPIGNSGPRVNRDAIYEDLMVSLERLRSDSVDLYALHRDDPDTPVGEIVEALNEHVEAGRIRAFGGSNWTWQRLEEANQYAKEHGLIGFSFSSPNLSLAKAKEPYWAGCVSADQTTIEWHEKTQMPLMSWSSQARGFFTGRYTRDNFENKDLVRVFYNDANWERYDRATELAKQKGVSTIQIALAYVLNQSFPCGAIIGPQNEAEMQSCAEAEKITLTKTEIEWLDLQRDTLDE